VPPGRCLPTAGPGLHLAGGKTFYGQTRAEVAKEVACKQSRQLGVTAFVGELTPPRFQVAL
jgi:hypothetical protein